MRDRLFRLKLAIVLVGLIGCSGHVSRNPSNVPMERGSNPVQAEQPAERCSEAEGYQAEASSLRRSGRQLRAHLYEQRAAELCRTRFPLPPRLRASSNPIQLLEDVYRWIATTDPRLALVPDRLSEPTIARTLDDAVIGLSGGDPGRLAIEVLTVNHVDAPRLGKTFSVMGGDSLARSGEWFERYAFPECEPGSLLGPFSERAVLFKKRGSQSEAWVLFDLIEGIVLREFHPVAESPSFDVSIHDVDLAVALDESHFAVVDRIDSGESTVELWRTWPPQALVRIVPPHPGDLIRPKQIITRSVPDAPKLRFRPQELEAEENLPAPLSANPSRPKLQNLGHGLLAVEFGTSLVLFDWEKGKVEAAFAKETTTIDGFARIAPSGRIVAMRPRSRWLTFFDRETKKSWEVTAPLHSAESLGTFSSDGRWFASAGSVPLVYLWDVKSGRLFRTLPSVVGAETDEASEGQLTPVAFAGPRELRVSNEFALQFRIDLKTGQLLPLPEEPEEGDEPCGSCRGSPSNEFWPQRGLKNSGFSRSMKLDGGATITLSPLDYRLEQSGMVTHVYSPSSPELVFSLAVDESHHGGILWSPDGRFELLGDRKAFGVHVRCRIDHRVLPLSACTEVLEWPGLHREMTEGKS